MKFITNVANAYGKECNGCKRFNKDVMLTFYNENTKEIVDVFLDNDMALELKNKLEQVLLNNTVSNTN